MRLEHPQLVFPGMGSVLAVRVRHEKDNQIIPLLYHYFANATDYAWIRTC